MSNRVCIPCCACGREGGGKEDDDVKKGIVSNEGTTNFSSCLDLSMFQRVEVEQRPKEAAPSKLGLLLAKYYEQTANPFFDYARLDGQVCACHQWEPAARLL